MRRPSYFPILLILLIVAPLLSPDRGAAETRRALLIGIDRYDQGLSPDDLAHVKASGRRTWPNLQGSVNDAMAIRELLLHRFGLQESNIVLLTNEEATRARILSEFERHLIAPAKPGDLSILFYAGHGSRIRNSNSPEYDKKDETIVPADANRGDARNAIIDIRDKEWDRLFTKVLDKGSKLTAIFDSCHSGSISRGAVPTTARVRFLDEDERDAAKLIGPEPPPHPPGQEPENRDGALIVSSAQEDQFASEAARRIGDRKEWHGAFTLALMDTLNSLPTDASSERVFDRVTAKLKAMGLRQDPVLAGLPARRHAPLFGGEAGQDAQSLHLNVVHPDGADEILLQGGLALGLTPGTELVPTHATAGNLLRLRITEVLDLLRSRAAVIQGNWKTIRAGDEFEVIHWGGEPERSLQIWMPALAPDEPAILSLALDLRTHLTTAGVNWVEDPTEHATTHILSWSGTDWVLSGPGGRLVRLGRTPTSEQVLAHLPDRLGVRLFMNQPPSPVLRSALVPLGKGGEGRAQVTQDPEEAHYVLVGRLAERHIEYAWVLRNFSVPRDRSTVVSSMPLPARTAWGAGTGLTRPCAEGGLKTCLPQLAKLLHWLTVESPSDDRRFPYRLAFVPMDGTQPAAANQLAEGAYRLMLESDVDTITRLQETWGIQSRYVYVFVIDQQGRATLLFPNEASKEREHLLPRLGATPPPIQDLVRVPMGDSGLINVHAPFGSDTYILLTASRDIPRVKELVETEAVDSIARRMRGQTDWSISRRFLQSVPGSTHRPSRP